MVMTRFEPFLKKKQERTRNRSPSVIDKRKAKSHTEYYYWVAKACYIGHEKERRDGSDPRIRKIDQGILG